MIRRSNTPPAFLMPSHRLIPASPSVPRRPSLGLHCPSNEHCVNAPSSRGFKRELMLGRVALNNENPVHSSQSHRHRHRHPETGTNLPTSSWARLCPTQSENIQKARPPSSSILLLSNTSISHLNLHCVMRPTYSHNSIQYAY